MITNYLKIHKNKTRILISILAFVFMFSDVVIANKGSKKRAANRSKNTKNGGVKNSRTKASKKTNNTNKSNTEKTTEQTQKNFVVDIAEVNRYNCESFYFKCMNQFCMDEKNGRCGCSDATKFSSSNKQCSYILEVCPSKLNDIVKNYKNGITTDCNEYALNKNRNAPSSSLSNVLAELTACMKPKCVANRTNDFVGCFDADNLEKKFEACKGTHQNISDVNLLKEMLVKSFVSYKQKYCDEIHGTLKADGECYLKIGIGASPKMIAKTKEFKVGDNVFCSESAFGVDLGDEEYRKIKYKKEIALFGMDLLKTGLNVASNIVGQHASADEMRMEANKETEKATKLKQATENGIANGIIGEDGKKKIDDKINEFEGNATLLKSAADSMTGGVETTRNVLTGIQGVMGSQHLAGAIGGIMQLNSEDFKRKGYCYVIMKNNLAKELFEMSDEYYYKIRWTPQWSESMLFKE